MKRRIALFLLLCLWFTFLPPAHAQSGYAWVRSIGRPVQFSGLTGVAVDTSGNIYVTNHSNNSIDAFDPQGNFLFDFGGTGPSSLYGTLNSPQKIVRDRAGSFYVADLYNNRIQKFDAKGRFLLQIGSYGSRVGQLFYPTGVAVDSAGNIYVADSYNYRIQKFNATGKFLLQFGNAQLSNQITAVTLDSAGNIYVADAGNYCIQKFNAAGKFLLKFGSNGSGNGQFGQLSDVAVDNSGNIYAADSTYGNIQKFTSSGKYVNAVSVSSVNAISFDSAGNLYAVLGYYSGGATIGVINPATMLWKYYVGSMGTGYLAVDSAGNTYATDSGRLIKFDTTGKILQNFPLSYSPYGVVVDSTGNIYMTDTADSKVLKYPANGGTPTIIAGSGNNNGQVTNPTGITLDSSGNLYVVDSGNSRVQKFSPTGTYLFQFGTSGSGSGQFTNPTDLAVDSSGNIYVLDAGNTRIEKFNATGGYKFQFGTYGTANGQFNQPGGLAVDSSGNIYVTDYGNNRIQRFNSVGAFAATFGTPFSTGPWGIRFDNTGNLLVTDSNTVLKFNTKGQWLGAYDGLGANYATFPSPQCLRIDSNNNLYVVGTGGEKVTTTGAFLGGIGGGVGLALDAANNIYVVGGNSVSKFNSSLTYVGGFGSQGTGNKQFNSPSGIALDSSGDIYVVDSGNYRVQKFTSSFAYDGQFGSNGTGDGQFSSPAGIAVTSNGDILVADYSQGLVDIFSPATFFPFLGSFGGYGYNTFYDPTDVNLDSEGNIYVTLQGNICVQMFDPSADFLYTIGGNYGGASGQLLKPTSSAVDSEGNIYITDSATNRISEFAPIPILSTVTPLTAAAGSAALTLNATGSGFTPDAALTFNGMPLTTTFISKTSLSATLPATMLANGGNFPVAILQAGGTSNAFTFTVTGITLPTVTSVNPTSTTAGISSVALTVTGTNFINGALIYFGNVGLPTTYVSATQLTATVPGTLLTTAGTVAVSVAQSGASSNAVNFMINSAGAPPAITSLSPASVDQGSAAQTLTITGTGFTSDAVVKFNGNALMTTFGSATQLTATVPANLLTAAGSYPVTVSQASGVSGAAGFSVNVPAPVITSFSPPNARVGSAALTLSIGGTGFTADAVVSFNNAALVTTFVSSTQVVATVPATALATAGIYPIVLTEAGGSSDPVSFTVNALPPTVTNMSPTAVLRGSTAINLVLTGSNFTSDAVISFNGTTLATTFGSSTQLSATVPASLLTTSGFYPVIVKQASGVSRKVLFIVL